MSDTPGRGYLPPTVPAPGTHRRQWPPPTSFSYFQNQWQPGKQYLVPSSSPPQSESMDLSSRTEVNGGDLNGTSVSVIAPNPLVALEEKPVKLSSESAVVFEPRAGGEYVPPKQIPGLPLGDEFIASHPSEGKTPSDLPLARMTPPSEEPRLLQPQVPLGAPAVPQGSAVTSLEIKPTVLPPLPASLPSSVQMSPVTLPSSAATPLEWKPSNLPSSAATPFDMSTATISSSASTAVEFKSFSLPSMAAASLEPDIKPPTLPSSVAATIKASRPDTAAVPLDVKSDIIPDSAAIPPETKAPLLPSIAVTSAATSLDVRPTSLPEPIANPHVNINPVPSPGSLPTPVDPDHVESLLENMFQEEAKPSVIVTNSSRPALTEDKVVEILQDKDTSLSEHESDVSSNLIKVEPLVENEAVPNVNQKEPTAEGVKEEPKENQFMEVESELEKMFAGIEEEPPPPASTEPNSSNVKRKKRPRPRQRKSVDSVDSKKKKAHKEVHRPKKTKREKENSNDSLSVSMSKSFRGPFVHLKGPKENPSYVTVVNSGSREEEEKERIDRRKHVASVEARGRRGPNLYNSTLSLKYNSQNVDTTWVCAFCKKRAHCEGGLGMVLGGEPAGDLFGPYILEFPKDSDTDRTTPSESEVSAEQKKKGGGKAASLRATGAMDNFMANFSKKSKKSLPGNEEIAGEKEVWVHEKCAVWAPGVYLTGPHLMGLAEAVASAALTKCSVCGLSGACIGCLRRNCPGRVHYGCALSSNWELDEEKYHPICPVHSAKNIPVVQPKISPKEKKVRAIAAQSFIL